VSRLDPSGADQADAEHPSRNRRVDGSNPTSACPVQGQHPEVLSLLFALLAHQEFRLLVIAMTAPMTLASSLCRRERQHAFHEGIGG
jgi:hypothetical protein